MYQPELSDFTTVNFAALREECIERTWTASQEAWSHVELVAINDILVAHAKKLRHEWRLNPGIRAMVRDLEELPVIPPKWTTLVGWLAPEGAACHAPAVVAEIAMKALDCELLPRKPK